jgi:hypothetical protein
MTTYMSRRKCRWWARAGLQNNCRSRPAIFRYQNDAIEVSGGPAEAADALRGFGLSPEGEAYVRTVRKAERSWDVASQLEDILQEALGLGPDVAIRLTVE